MGAFAKIQNMHMTPIPITTICGSTHGIDTSEYPIDTYTNILKGESNVVLFRHPYLIAVGNTSINTTCVKLFIVCVTAIFEEKNATIMVLEFDHLRPSKDPLDKTPPTNSRTFLPTLFTMTPLMKYGRRLMSPMIMLLM